MLFEDERPCGDPLFRLSAAPANSPPECRDTKEAQGRPKKNCPVKTSRADHTEKGEISHCCCINMCCAFRAGLERYGLCSYKISEKSTFQRLSYPTLTNKWKQEKEEDAPKSCHLSVGNLPRTRSPNTRHTTTPRR